MDAFDAIFSDGVVTGTVKTTVGNRTKTAKLDRGPRSSMSPEAFAEAAREGTNFTDTVKDDDHTRTRNRKGVTGTAAERGVARLMNLPVHVDPVPPKVKNRAKAAPAESSESGIPTPSENGVSHS